MARRPQIDSDNPGGAYGLFLINSSSFAAGATGSVDGLLAATWYFNQGGIILSGTIAGIGTTVASGSGVLIEETGTPSTSKIYSTGFPQRKRWRGISN